MPEPTISRMFAGFITGISASTLPTTILAQAKLRILDNLSTAIAGHGLPVPTAAAALAGRNTGAATVIGSAGQVPAVDAAFINATLVNGRTQDDFLYKSHPGAVSVPAALAICEEDGASGADLVAAVVAGYELTARAYLGGPTMLPAFRATGVAGAIGACAAASRAMRLDVEQTVNALGLAAIFASGFGAGFLTGTMDVKLNVGMAARNGVSAAILARAGATASDRAFEGEAGYYAAVARTTANAGAAVAGLGHRYLIEDTVYKDYPICIFTQTPVAIAKAMVEAHRLTAAQIQRVTVTICDLTFTNPGFQNVAPFANQLKARVSARFCIAAAMLGRPIDMFEFYDQVDDAELLDFAQRIDLVVDPARADSVTIAITTADGVITNEGSEGETLHPTEAKVVAKFERLVAPILGADTAYLLADIMSLEQQPEIRRLTEWLRPGRPALRVTRS
jgi:2-methylcitrate dehydratase PrpD